MSPSALPSLPPPHRLALSLPHAPAARPPAPESGSGLERRETKPRRGGDGHGLPPSLPPSPTPTPSPHKGLDCAESRPIQRPHATSDRRAHNGRLPRASIAAVSSEGRAASSSSPADAALNSHTKGSCFGKSALLPLHFEHRTEGQGGGVLNPLKHPVGLRTAVSQTGQGSGVDLRQSSALSQYNASVREHIY